MAQQDEYIRRDTLQVPVVGITAKTTRNGDQYLDVQVKRRPDLQYPDTLKCWDRRQLEEVEKAGPGAIWNFVLAAKKLKANKTDDGNWSSYDWQILGLAELDDAQPATAPAPGGPQTASAPATPPAGHQQPPAVGNGRPDPARRSIERQVALKLAVESAQFLVDHDIQQVDGEVAKFTGIVANAFRFYAGLLKEDI